MSLHPLLSTNLNRMAKMLRYLKPKLSTSSNSSVTTAQTSTPTNMSYTVCSTTSSDTVTASNGNIIRTQNTEQPALVGEALSAYYKQIGLSALQQHVHEHSITSSGNKVSDSDEQQQQNVDVEYQLRSETEERQYHDMGVRKKRKELVVVEEPEEKRIKFDDVASRVSPHQAHQGPATVCFEIETGSPTQTHRVFPSNTWRAVPAKTKSSSQSRDTSKLPTEEAPEHARAIAVMQQKPTVGLHLTPEIKAQLMWQKVRAENLDCDYVKVFSKREADELFQECEATLTFYTGELAQIKVYGKRFDIPRKQVAHGDEGVTYTYSGVTMPAKPWTPVLNQIRERIQDVTQHKFNFVLINRYEDGNHYVGEHRDNEKELRRAAPIASVSLGCTRDFVFRHADSRGREAKRQIPPIKLQLEHGSLLVMKYPTNEYWYHSLPVRRKAKLPRINLTFRDVVTKEMK